MYMLPIQFANFLLIHGNVPKFIFLQFSYSCKVWGVQKIHDVIGAVLDLRGSYANIIKLF